MLLIATITDKDESEIWDMDLSKVSDLMSKLIFLNNFELPDIKINFKIQLPNYKLKLMKDVTKINIAQYIDYQTFLKSKDHNIEQILSVFLIPEGFKYNTDYDILDLQREIRENLSFRLSQGLLHFFLVGYVQSLMRTLTYYVEKIKKMKTETEEKKEMIVKHQKVKDQINHLMCLIG